MQALYRVKLEECVYQWLYILKTCAKSHQPILLHDKSNYDLEVLQVMTQSPVLVSHFPPV